MRHHTPLTGSPPAPAAVPAAAWAAHRPAGTRLQGPQQGEMCTNLFKRCAHSMAPKPSSSRNKTEPSCALPAQFCTGARPGGGRPPRHQANHARTRRGVVLDGGPQPGEAAAVVIQDAHQRLAVRPACGRQGIREGGEATRATGRITLSMDAVPPAAQCSGPWLQNIENKGWRAPLPCGPPLASPASTSGRA